MRRGGTIVVLPPGAGPSVEGELEGGFLGDAVRWAQRGAKRLLAPPAAKPTVPPEIDGLIRQVQWVLGKLPSPPTSGGKKPKKAKFPTGVRFLDAAEQAVASKVFGRSLDFGRILVSDGLGLEGRPFTVAVKLSSGWYVVMNVGDLRSRASGTRSDTLVHELAHAWQSQHHGSNPGAFMNNSLQCQAAAAAAARFYGEPVSAYAYVPGKAFGQYAAEQIAQQVEDGHRGRGRPTPVVIQAVRSLGPGARSADNERSLTVTSYHRKSEPGVVFP